MTISHQDVRDILDILDHAEHLESIDLKIGDFHLRARKPGALPHGAEPTAWPVGTQPIERTRQQDSVHVTAKGSQSLAAQEDVPEGMVTVSSPMVGTFYARPSPDQPPFVDVGSAVQASDTVGLVEVMKMFNTIKAGVSGTVQRIVVESGKPVQQGQTLLLIAPNSGV